MGNGRNGKYYGKRSESHGRMIAKTAAFQSKAVDNLNDAIQDRIDKLILNTPVGWEVDFENFKIEKQMLKALLDDLWMPGMTPKQFVDAAFKGGLRVNDDSVGNDGKYTPPSVGYKDFYQELKVDVATRTSDKYPERPKSAK